MKKYLMIIPFLIIIFLFIKPKSNTKKEIVNPFSKYSFYQEELYNEYLDYQEKTHYSIKKVIIDVNIGLNKPFYQNTKLSKHLNTNYILVNKYTYLPKDYVPNNLVTLTEFAKPGIKLVEEAYNAFKEMAHKAQDDTMTLRIISAYRSFEYQENLYNKYLKRDSKEKVDTYSARPGYSEHQTGLSIDIDNTIIDYNKFHLTQEFTWMQGNAYKYGFILRYPLGKEKITGYKYESWHYRYVGRDIAKYIHDNDITFDEYYHEFINKKT